MSFNNVVLLSAWALICYALGASFLILPTWLNWFTANIGYHHIHHLSARIPNYGLLECHNEHRHLLSDVNRLRLADVPGALKCILWDARASSFLSRNIGSR